ncbi:signal peptide containing protein [Theileria equi strain WA]|uniref:Signal peptide containing protein n=1 Tax=Theileria equi strain WA TaxID=1537102 RepID=L1LAU7_THEEQ|nr:signal peptide containing protein [Theileria equi strain WA]EKX72587.1 signal peptide containing protein [Theileria equi strain WA]|eukprot:XP_004832039.1 signal peptide containing protein [Theileria equi strain WA]
MRIASLLFIAFFCQVCHGKKNYRVKKRLEEEQRKKAEEAEAKRALEKNKLQTLNSQGYEPVTTSKEPGTVERSSGKKPVKPNTQAKEEPAPPKEEQPPANPKATGPVKKDQGVHRPVFQQATSQANAQPAAKSVKQAPKPAQLPASTVQQVNKRSIEQPKEQNVKPTLLTDLKSGVDSSRFDVQEVKEGDFSVLTLKEKIDANIPMLFFNGQLVWRSEYPNDSCSSAAFYFGQDNEPVAATFRFKTKDHKTVEGYRKFCNNKWLQVNKKTFYELLASSTS